MADDVGSQAAASIMARGLPSERTGEAVNSGLNMGMALAQKEQEIKAARQALEAQKMQIDLRKSDIMTAGFKDLLTAPDYMKDAYIKKLHANAQATGQIVDESSIQAALDPANRAKALAAASYLEGLPENQKRGESIMFWNAMAQDPKAAMGMVEKYNSAGVDLLKTRIAADAAKQKGNGLTTDQLATHEGRIKTAYNVAPGVSEAKTVIDKTNAFMDVAANPELRDTQTAGNLIAYALGTSYDPKTGIRDAEMKNLTGMDETEFKKLANRAKAIFTGKSVTDDRQWAAATQMMDQLAQRYQDNLYRYQETAIGSTGKSMGFSRDTVFGSEPRLQDFDFQGVFGISRPPGPLTRSQKSQQAQQSPQNSAAATRSNPNAQTADVIQYQKLMNDPEISEDSKASLTSAFQNKYGNVPNVAEPKASAPAPVKQQPRPALQDRNEPTKPTLSNPKALEIASMAEDVGRPEMAQSYFKSMELLQKSISEPSTYGNDKAEKFYLDQMHTIEAELKKILESSATTVVVNTKKAAAPNKK